MAGYSYPDDVMEEAEKQFEKNREQHKDRVAGIISSPPVEPLKPGEEAGSIPMKHLAQGKPSGSALLSRDEYIRSLKVRSAVDAITQFRADVGTNTVPGDADDIGMAAYMVYRLMERQSRISKTHGYFVPAAIKDGMAWLRVNFEVGSGSAAELSPANALGSSGDGTAKRALPPGQFGLPQRDYREEFSRDLGTVDDADGGSDSMATIMEAEMREKYPQQFVKMDAAEVKTGAADAWNAKYRPAGDARAGLKYKPGAPTGGRGPLDNAPATNNYRAGNQSASPWTESNDMPDTDPTAPPSFGGAAPYGSNSPDGAPSSADGVAGLNETLSKLSGQMGGGAGMPSGEGGGIYDMQEAMNVALPSDEDGDAAGDAYSSGYASGSTAAAGDEDDNWGTGQTGHGAAMEQEYGAPTGAAPGQKEEPLRPVFRRTEEGRSEMEALGEILAERVIGQEAAVDLVATTMQMCYVGLQASSGPLGVFLFVGPSGVGKTELAKALAAQLFGEETDMFRIDMSGFKAKGDVATLVGAPKGYQDSKDGGTLTTFMAAHKHGSVVLLDEVEKAHPEVLDLFLPCFDEGYLTDARGVRHECKQTVFIMTSNLGTPQLHEAMLSQQAALDAGDIDEDEAPLDADAVEEIVEPVIQSRLRPELLGRVDGTAFFRPLVPADIRTIAVMALSELAVRVTEASGGRLELQPHASLIDVAVAGSIKSPQYGARGVQRAVQRQIAVPLSKLMLRHRLDAIGLESDPNSSALRETAEDTSGEPQRVLELMLTPDGSGELMGRLMPEDRALMLAEKPKL